MLSQPPTTLDSAPGAALHERPLTQARSERLYFEIIFLTVAAALFLAFTLPNLSNFPVPSDDEIWILGVSHKLASEGVFGTDMFTGYYRADEVYLFNMPGHHFVLAAVFKIFGTGILEGRLVSIVYGLLTMGLVYLFARKLYGVTAAVLSVVLLVFLRLNLGFDTGLPLQEMSRSIRYDLAPLPFMLAGGIVLLNPTPLRVAGAGALFALATLMQFYGALMFPVAALYLLLEAQPLRDRIKLLGLAAAAAIIVVLPYGVFVASNYEEWKGQLSTLESRRDTDLGSLWDNFSDEPDRFAFRTGTIEKALLDQPSGKLALLFGLPATILFLAIRYWQRRERGDRLLVLCLIFLPLGLAVLESQKIAGYWIAAFPFLCVGLAFACIEALRWASHLLSGPARRATPPGSRVARFALAGVAAVFLLIALAEGAYTQSKGLRTFDNATEYLSLRETIGQYVPEGSRVVGSTSLWWAMPETEFRSYYMLFYRTNPKTTERMTTIPGYFDEFGTEYVVLNRISRFFLQRLIARDKDALAQYLETRGEQIAYLEDRSYGWIEIWKISP